MKKFKALLLIAALGGLWFYLATRPTSLIQQPASDGEIFVISRGEATDTIVNRLKQAGLIHSSLAFNLVLYQQGLMGKIQAGDFRLSREMNALEIVQSLTHGTLDQWTVFIEGWRAEEIAAELKLPNSEFVSEEGFLFPDTYLMPKNASPAAVIKILKNNFDKKIDSLLADIKKSDLTLKQVIILASLVEREVSQDQDRAIVAGILLKRWQNDWPLQVDATVQYALGRDGNWWPKVSKADLEIKSAYNTYLYRGLPPGPICNPGLASIKAVIYPKESEYWFYLSDRQGQMHYARTLEEHNSNKKYL